jgi:hypothetical protein
MYDHIAQNRPEVTKAFQAAVEQPGPQVMAAISEFEASAVAGTAGTRFTEHSMASLLLEGFKRCDSEAVLEDARGLMMNAVVRSQELSALISEVRAEGVFDREMSEQDVRVGDLTGFKDFDPSTATGRMRWRQLRENFIRDIFLPLSRSSSV